MFNVFIINLHYTDEGVITMNLKHLEFFIAVVEEENFSRAADKLFTSQPNISKGIQQLESDIGIQLFDRQPRKVVLNRYGKFFYKHIVKALTELDNAEKAIKEFIDPDKGVINLSFIHSLGSTLIPELIHEYQQIYPNVHFNLLQGSTDVLLDDLINGETDFCFLMDREFPPTVEHIKLFEEMINIILPINHRLASKEKIDLIDLKDDPFISFKLGIGLRNSMDLICEKAGFSPKIRFECQEVDTVVGFVESGLGVALVPRIKGIESYHIKIKLLQNKFKHRNVNLAMRKNVFQSPIVLNFYEYLANKFKF